jgi:hypothetical protein
MKVSARGAAWKGDFRKLWRNLNSAKLSGGCAKNEETKEKDKCNGSEEGGEDWW